MLDLDSNQERPEAYKNPYEFTRAYRLQDQGHPIEFSRWPHLKPIYEDTCQNIVLMTSSQSGKTTYLLVRTLWELIRNWGVWIGYYFPDFFLPDEFSKNRFKPMVEENIDMKRFLGGEVNSKKKQDNVRGRKFGKSIIYFLSTRSLTGTEGLPLGGICLDEVRRMMQPAIDAVEQRITAQVDPFNIKASTANYPDLDIDAYFQRSTQNKWISNCSCSDGVNLAEMFPDCIGQSNGTTPVLKKYEGKPFYVCPKCGDVVDTPLDGQYVEYFPGRKAHGYHISKILSPVYTADRLWEEYNNTPTVKEFYNSGLGLSYIDKEAQPITPDVLYSCEDYPRWEESGTLCGMGIDSMGGYNVVVIKKKLDNGKFATIHLEVVIDDDPWKRCADLMKIYDCTCIADAKPNWNEALRFAKHFLGRVWLATYATGDNPLSGEMVQWGDRVKDKKTQASDDKIKYKYTARIDRFKAIDWSLKRFVNRENSLPPRGLLRMWLPKKDGKVVLSAGMKQGKMELTKLAEEVYYVHLQKIAKRTIPVTTKDGEDTGLRRNVWVNQGLDPHFVHSDLYANMALMRKRQPRFTSVRMG